ncbi:hypothetical protein [Edaphobacter modestus]|uniref:Uncharacterized protein n=1 Tax=Edaphobacter modestus TaxID=388466 RepID=A0A4V2G423_9BACT|nr:hypothetical protein [Edaphobacter modestus]RZU39306.1 hypothetical protein BDD14_0675 [Edaphobacter modestus]
MSENAKNPAAQNSTDGLAGGTKSAQIADDNVKNGFGADQIGGSYAIEADPSNAVATSSDNSRSHRVPSNSDSGPETITQEDRGQLKWNEQRSGEAATSNNPKESSDWLGGPQNGNEIPGNGGNGGNGQVTSGETTPSNSVDRVPPWSTIEDPPEYNAENAKNPKEGSDWLGGPQNGAQIPADKAQGSDWLGGPQNGNETPSEAARNPQTGEFQKPSSSPETTTQEQWFNSDKGFGSERE